MFHALFMLAVAETQFAAALQHAVPLRAIQVLTFYSNRTATTRSTSSLRPTLSCTAGCHHSFLSELTMIDCYNVGDDLSLPVVDDDDENYDIIDHTTKADNNDGVDGSGPIDDRRATGKESAATNGPPAAATATPPLTTEGLSLLVLLNLADLLDDALTSLIFAVADFFPLQDKQLQQRDLAETATSLVAQQQQQQQQQHGTRVVAMANAVTRGGVFPRVRWHCEALLPRGYAFTSANVSCERMPSPCVDEDTERRCRETALRGGGGGESRSHILRGSCRLQYAIGSSSSSLTAVIVTTAASSPLHATRDGDGSESVSATASRANTQQHRFSSFLVVPAHLEHHRDRPALRRRALPGARALAAARHVLVHGALAERLRKVSMLGGGLGLAGLRVVVVALGVGARAGAPVAARAFARASTIMRGGAAEESVAPAGQRSPTVAARGGWLHDAPWVPASPWELLPVAGLEVDAHALAALDARSQTRLFIALLMTELAGLSLFLGCLCTCCYVVGLCASGGHRRLPPPSRAPSSTPTVTASSDAADDVSCAGLSREERPASTHGSDAIATTSTTAPSSTPLSDVTDTAGRAKPSREEGLASSTGSDATMTMTTATAPAPTPAGPTAVPAAPPTTASADGAEATPIAGLSGPIPTARRETRTQSHSR